MNLTKIDQDARTSLVQADQEADISYKAVADSYGLVTEQQLPYLVCGPIPETRGWVLHISVIKAQVLPMLHAILPLLKDLNIPFKIPASTHIADSIVHGASGYLLLGKMACIYCPGDNRLVPLTRKLIELTKGFAGPAIPTDIYLGGAVFTRYGAFNPILVSEIDGSVQEYMKDENGELSRDEQTVPFVMPKNTRWPFRGIASPKPKKRRKIFPGGYVNYAILKSDMKGAVIKAISFNKFPTVDWCLIKEGNKFMCMEESGLDIRDRLQWQMELHRDLAGVAPLPKLLDYFHLNENHYLVLEYIEGFGGLDLFVQYIFNDNTWRGLPRAVKLDLVDFALQVLHAIKALHERGFVHRDITLPNFLLDKKGKLHMIDLELAYSITQDKPFPPFKLGTQGHMSPEQLEGIRPTLKEDLYALGATLLVMFTGIHPYKIRPGSPEALRHHLVFFLDDAEIAAAITSCLSNDPALRPDVASLITAVTGFRERIMALRPEPQPVPLPYQTVEEIFIQDALNTFGSKRMLSSRNLWFSKTIQRNAPVGNELIQRSIYIGLQEGVAGPMHLVATAKLAGYDVSAIEKAYQVNLDYISEKILQDIRGEASGFITGTAGLAVALASGARAGLINSPDVAKWIIRCLSNPCKGSDLAVGLAGHGLALLHARDIVHKTFFEENFAKVCDEIVTLQLPGGEWHPVVEEGLKKVFPVTGFAHGVAGITYFLLQAYQLAPEARWLLAIKKALHWLTKQGKEKDQYISWPVLAGQKGIDNWAANGIAGVALVFLEAARVLESDEYASTAVKGLNCYPHCRVDFALSQNNGLAGLGEVYLEAQKVLGDLEWMERASWIKELLVNAYIRENKDVFWLVDHNSIPTPDLLVGNAGLLHFLIRYNDPQKIKHLFAPPGMQA